MRLPELGVSVAEIEAAWPRLAARLRWAAEPEPLSLLPALTIGDAHRHRWIELRRIGTASTRLLCSECGREDQVPR